MAINSTVFKASLNISDMDRHYYAEHILTLALHPSETEERLMVRLLAFALYANDSLVFAKGLASDDEPDLWQKDLTGAIECWMMVGLPDEKLIRKACGRAAKVVLITYGRTADVWWKQNASKFTRLNNVTILNLPADATIALAELARRNMQIQCTIEDRNIMLASDEGMVEINFEVLAGEYLP